MKPSRLFLALSLLAPAACLDEPVDTSEESSDLDVVVLCPSTTPVFGPPVVYAPGGNVLARPPVYYMTGNTLDIAFVLPTCTSLTNVVRGTVELGKTSGGVDAPSAWYEVVSDSTSSPGWHETKIRLHFSSPPVNGVSIPVKLTAKDIWGTKSATTELIVSHVKQINGPVSLTLSRTELHNGFIESLYGDYGDDSSYTDGGDHYYGVDYGGSHVNVDTDGVRLQQRMTKSVPTCDPALTVTARFHLTASGSTVTPVYTSGPNVATNFDNVCSIATLGIPKIVSWFKDKKIQKIRDKVQAQVDAALAGSCSACGPLLQSIETKKGELRVNLNPKIGNAIELPRIAIEVPYNTMYTKEPNSFGVALRPGDQVIAGASGLAKACSSATSATPSSGCETVEVGPSGALNFTSYTTVPSPWVLFGTVYAYYAERHKARNQLLGFTRDTTKLPIANGNVGGLVARGGNFFGLSGHGSVATPCTIQGNPWIVDRVGFGANDYRTANGYDYGTGTYQVTLAFLPDGITLPIAPCY